MSDAPTDLEQLARWVEAGKLRVDLHPGEHGSGEAIHHGGVVVSDRIEGQADQVGVGHITQAQRYIDTGLDQIHHIVFEHHLDLKIRILRQKTLKRRRQHLPAKIHSAGDAQRPARCVLRLARSLRCAVYIGDNTGAALVERLSDSR